MLESIPSLKVTEEYYYHHEEEFLLRDDRLIKAQHLGGRRYHSPTRETANNIVAADDTMFIDSTARAHKD